MGETVTVHAVKTHLPEPLARVEAGKVIIIVHGKTPVAKLVPVAPAAKRRFSAMHGRISLDPAFCDPLPQSELNVWEQ